jgi:Tfp pilus assembly protein PilN
MTTTAKVKVSKPFLPVRKPKPGAAVSTTAPVAKAVKSNSGANLLVVGGEPRVHLLPKEVIERKKSKATSRRLGFGVVGVAVIVAAGVVVATLSMMSANTALSSAQAQTVLLQQQQAKYGQVTKIKADAAAIQASQKLATAQEIAWQPYITDLQATLPAGASITAITAGIDSPFAAPTSTTVIPLQGPRIATLTATLVMPQGSISGWLNSLAALKGFVDANPDSVIVATGGDYTVAVTIHVNSGALANRFTKVAGTN